MLIAAVVLFAIATIGGLVLASKHMQQQDFPAKTALPHGLVSALGLVALIIAAVQRGVHGYLLYALILFVVAALGGFVLFSLHGKKQPLPKPGLVVHAVAGVVGLVLVILALVASK